MKNRVEDAVEQDKEAVVPVYGHTALLDGLHGAQCPQLGQVHPAEGQHVQDEHSLEEEEQDAPEELPPGDGAKSHHKVGDAGLPVALHKGFRQVLKVQGCRLKEMDRCPPQLHQPLNEPPRQFGKKPSEVMEQAGALAHFQVFQISHAITIPAVSLRPDEKCGLGAERPQPTGEKVTWRPGRCRCPGSPAAAPAAGRRSGR